MILYLCDVKDCGLEAKNGGSHKDWVSQEMFDAKVEGASYFWARIGFANVTLCPEHYRQAMRSLVKDIDKKYPA